jgi:hypothetical protein
MPSLSDRHSSIPKVRKAWHADVSWEHALRSAAALSGPLPPVGVELLLLVVCFRWDHSGRAPTKPIRGLTQAICLARITLIP